MLTCSGLVFSMALSNADEKLVAALCAPPSTGFSQRRSPSTLCILSAVSIAVLVCCKADLILDQAIRCLKDCNWVDAM